MDNNDDTLPTPNNNSGDYCDEFSQESYGQLKRNQKVNPNYLDKYLSQGIATHKKASYD